MRPVCASTVLWATIASYRVRHRRLRWPGARRTDPNDLRYRGHLPAPRRPFPRPETPLRLTRPAGDGSVLVNHTIGATQAVAAQRELLDVIEGLHAGRCRLRAVEA